LTRQKLREIVGRMNAEVCDQCGKCPSAYPTTVRLEGFNPHQIIKVNLGREEDLMETGVIWTCTSCLKYRERYPEEISPMMSLLNSSARPSSMESYTQIATMRQRRRLRRLESSSSPNRVRHPVLARIGGV